MMSDERGEQRPNLMAEQKNGADSKGAGAHRARIRAGCESNLERLTIESAK